MAITDLTATIPDLAAGTAGDRIGSPLKHKRLGRLLVSYLVTLFFVVNLNFFLPRALPGNALDTLIGGASTGRGATQLTVADRAKLAHYYGFDRSLLAQYGHYMNGLVHGSLGISIRYNVPVTRLLLARLPWSLMLVVAAMALATSVGMVTGIHSGWKRGQRVDRGLLGLFIVIGNFPVYVIAFLALIVFGAKLHWFPLGGTQAFVHRHGAAQAVDICRHLALPAGVLALQFVFLQYLVMRGGVVSELGADHLLMGRAKGLLERRLKYRYAARNALLPVFTLVALNAGLAVGASIFVERVFVYQGVGQLMFDSIAYRDYPTMQGCFLIISLVVLTLNLATDLLYHRVDPRVGR